MGGRAGKETGLGVRQLQQRIGVTVHRGGLLEAARAIEEVAFALAVLARRQHFG